jgi:redox-sensitive bicupin YhaK (pirin superfamily)
MNNRQAAILFEPTAVDEAKGVTIRRVIGGERMAILDPILLLDHASIAAESDVVGFPRHPHRGIETISYVLTGEVGHKDSIGNESVVGPGGTQWMTAGNGIYHEEMMRPGAEGAEMLQLWFSLPKAQKRVSPAYQGGPADDVPEINENGAKVRIVAGTYNGTQGLFTGIAVKPTILDVTLDADQNIKIQTAAGEAVLVYIVRGSVTAADRTAMAPEVIVFGDGQVTEIHARGEGARFLFVSAKPLDEPILQYRSLVMNTVDDIRETLDMIEAGTFGNL